MNDNSRRAVRPAHERHDEAARAPVGRRAFTRAAASVAASALLEGSASVGLAAATDTTSRSRRVGPVIATTAGRIRGGRDRDVSYFKGIPYGASTAGHRRFQPPVAVQPWKGVRDALTLGTRSPQLPNGLIPEVAAVDDSDQPMGEDCLCLNVWTREARRGGRRPVMVWLHGGGFSSGSGGFKIYDGTNLARRHDVVVVTVNHRLNAFGFLFLPDVGGAEFTHASNVGMLDLVLALEWVRDNAAAFGGDPGNVTIFGQSGGGGKVSTLMAMPAAEGLFHKAIVMSGSSIDGVSREAANRSTAAYMARLGLKPTAADVVRMQAMPARQILAATGSGGSAGSRALRLAPVVDGKSLPANPFDPVAPRISARVPLLVGTTQNEVGFFPGFPLDPIDDATMRRRLARTLHAHAGEVDRVVSAYRKDQPGISPIDVVSEISSDLFTWRNALTQAERKAAQRAAPVFMYYFKWESPVDGGKLKAFHTLDIPFVFDNVDIARSMTGTGQDRYPLERRMSAAWTAFARSGRPEAPELPRWPAFDVPRRATMFLDDRCTVVDDPRHDDRLALASLPPGRGI